MNRTHILPIALILFFLAGCGTVETIKQISIGSDFEKNSRAYIQLVRWHELESAMNSYASPSIREEYRKKIAAAEGVQVVDYRIKNMECDPAKGVGSLKVEIDYYRSPSIRILTVVDNQEWVLEQEEKGIRDWRLKTVLPDFK